MKKQYYETLGISENASFKEIKKVFKKLSKKWHPDVNKSPEATVMMQQINNAYQWLMINHRPPRYYSEENSDMHQNSHSSNNSSAKKANPDEWVNPYEKYRYAYGTMGYARYMSANLSAVLGGKISQERYNSTLF